MSRRLALLFGAALLTGCDERPDHAEWRDVCVASHSVQTGTITQMMYCGQGCFMPLTTPLYTDVCDRTERQCFGGKDGSILCAPEPQ